jgi:predicted small secreted protein
MSKILALFLVLCLMLTPCADTLFGGGKKKKQEEKAANEMKKTVGAGFNAMASSMSDPDSMAETMAIMLKDPETMEGKR